MVLARQLFEAHSIQLRSTPAGGCGELDERAGGQRHLHERQALVAALHVDSFLDLNVRAMRRSTASLYASPPLLLPLTNGDCLKEISSCRRRSCGR